MASVKQAIDSGTYNAKGSTGGKKHAQKPIARRDIVTWREKLIELGRELSALKEFLAALTAERDAIISFSLEGIIRENNRKEEILKRLEYIETEKENLLSSPGRPCRIGGKRGVEVPRGAARSKSEGGENGAGEEYEAPLLLDGPREVIAGKNIEFINRTSYKKGRSISIMVSRRV